MASTREALMLATSVRTLEQQLGIGDEGEHGAAEVCVRPLDVVILDDFVPEACRDIIRLNLAKLSTSLNLFFLFSLLSVTSAFTLFHIFPI